MFSLNTDRRSVGLLSALPLLFLGFPNPVSMGRGLTPRKLEAAASSSKGFRPPGPEVGLLLALRPRASSSSPNLCGPPDNPGVAARFWMTRAGGMLSGNSGQSSYKSCLAVKELPNITTMPITSYRQQWLNCWIIHALEYWLLIRPKAISR